MRKLRKKRSLWGIRLSLYGGEKEECKGKEDGFVMVKMTWLLQMLQVVRGGLGLLCAFLGLPVTSPYIEYVSYSG